MPTTTIERLANGGDGVGHLPDGRVVFVPRTAPGDVVDIKIEKSKKRWARGSVVRIVEASPARIEAQCSHFDQCGGCNFQHLDYDVEFAAKVAAATEAFERLSGTPRQAGQAHQASSAAGYRIRARFHTDGYRLGYLAARSHEVFRLRSCPVLEPSLDAVVVPLCRALQGVRGEVEIETAGPDGGVVTVRAAGSDELAETIAALEGVRGVRFTKSGCTAGTYAVDAREVLAVPVELALRPGRFRQSNGPMTSVLRAVVRDRLGTGADLVEYFAGSGSFTFQLTDNFSTVLALEVDPYAVQVGNDVASALRLAHVRFETADLESRAADDLAGATVLLDPPRTGAAVLCAQLAEASPARIVYVSCDVATLARDARMLTGGGFRLESLDFVDMFPRTAHIESVATFVPVAA